MDVASIKGHFHTHYTLTVMLVVVVEVASSRVALERKSRPHQSNPS